MNEADEKRLAARLRDSAVHRHNVGQHDVAENYLFAADTIDNLTRLLDERTSDLDAARAENARLEREAEDDAREIGDACACRGYETDLPRTECAYHASLRARATRAESALAEARERVGAWLDADAALHRAYDTEEEAYAAADRENRTFEAMRALTRPETPDAGR